MLVQCAGERKEGREEEREGGREGGGVSVLVHTHTFHIEVSLESSEMPLNNGSSW